MTQFERNERDRLLELLTRREFFSRLGMGAGAMALAALLADQAEASAVASPQKYDLTLGPPHFRARAKRVIYLFQNGGPSQVDLFDPKPELNKRAGERPASGFVNDVDAKKTGVWLGSPFKFNRHGASGLELSELLPQLGRHADEIAVVRSMVSEHENHEQACCYMHTGSVVAGRPTLGSWVTYALGTENANLPAFVALLSPAGLPV